MGLLKPGEKRYVATTKMMESTETTELTRSVMMRAWIWSIERTLTSDTALLAGSGGDAMSSYPRLSVSGESKQYKQDVIRVQPA